MTERERQWLELCGKHAAQVEAEALAALATASRELNELVTAGGSSAAILDAAAHIEVRATASGALEAIFAERSKA